MKIIPTDTIVEFTASPSDYEKIMLNINKGAFQDLINKIDPQEYGWRSVYFFMECCIILVAEGADKITFEDKLLHPLMKAWNRNFQFNKFTFLQHPWISSINFAIDLGDMLRLQRVYRTIVAGGIKGVNEKDLWQLFSTEIKDSKYESEYIPLQAYREPEVYFYNGAARDSFSKPLASRGIRIRK